MKNYLLTTAKHLAISVATFAGFAQLSAFAKTEKIEVHCHCDRDQKVSAKKSKKSLVLRNKKHSKTANSKIAKKAKTKKSSASRHAYVYPGAASHRSAYGYGVGSPAPMGKFSNSGKPNAYIARRSAYGLYTVPRSEYERDLLARRRLSSNTDSLTSTDVIESHQSSASTTTVNTATGSSQQKLKKVAPADPVASPLFLSTEIYYNGAALADPLSKYETNALDGYEDDSVVSADVTTTLGYHLNPNWDISANPHFVIAPSNDKTGDGSHFLLPANSYIRLNAKSFVKEGVFNWGGDFRFYPGITNDMRGQNDQINAIYRTGQNFSWQVAPQTKIALYNTLRYLQRNGAVYTTVDSSKPDWRFTISPALEHQFSDNVSAAVIYSIDRNHPQDQPLGLASWQDNVTGNNSVEINSTIGLTKRISISPYMTAFLFHVGPFTVKWGAALNIGIL